MVRSGHYFLVQKKKKKHLEYPKPVFIYDVTEQQARAEILERFPGGRIVLQLDISSGTPKWGMQPITLVGPGKAEKYFIEVADQNFFFNLLKMAYRREHPDNSCKDFVYEMVQARVVTMVDEQLAFSIVEHWR